MPKRGLFLASELQQLAGHQTWQWRKNQHLEMILPDFTTEISISRGFPSATLDYRRCRNLMCLALIPVSPEDQSVTTPRHPRLVPRREVWPQRLPGRVSLVGEDWPLSSKKYEFWTVQWGCHINKVNNYMQYLICIYIYTQFKVKIVMKRSIDSILQFHASPI